MSVSLHRKVFDATTVFIVHYQATVFMDITVHIMSVLSLSILIASEPIIEPSVPSHISAPAA